MASITEAETIRYFNLRISEDELRYLRILLNQVTGEEYKSMCEASSDALSGDGETPEGYSSTADLVGLRFAVNAYRK